MKFGKIEIDVMTAIVRGAILLVMALTAWSLQKIYSLEVTQSGIIQEVMDMRSDIDELQKNQK